MRALLLAVLLFAGAAQAQPAARPPQDARALASQVLTRLAGPTLAEQVVAGQRKAMIAALEKAGQPAPEAANLFDSYFLPEYRARVPELLTALQDVLVGDFTVPELRAILDNRDSPVRRAAEPKLQGVPARLGDAERRWAARVGPEAYEKNKAELQRLGLNMSGGAR